MNTNKTLATKVRDFLSDMAEHEIIQSNKYDIRIELKDGDFNSYIGFTVEVNDWKHNPPVLQSVSLFRHTNDAKALYKTWSFMLGNVCHLYHDEPDNHIRFETYGKTADEAESEAVEFFAKIKKLIQKQTSEYKVKATISAEEERTKLLARLKELEGDK